MRQSFSFALLTSPRRVVRLIGKPVYSPQGHVLGQAMENLVGEKIYSLEDLIGTPDLAKGLGPAFRTHRVTR